MYPIIRKQTVLFLDGTAGVYDVYVYDGAAFVADPTAYCYHNGKFTWLVPGESVSWVESK